MIKILYEDKDILVIDKPSGVLVHPDQRSKEETILDFFKKKYPKLEIVHRLDKETSGVLILAKNEKIHEFLKKQFSAPALRLKTKSGLADRQNRIKKRYIAIVEGWPKNDHGIIDKPIGRSPSDFRRRLAGRGARGEMREAITEWKVLKRFEARTQSLPSEGRCLRVLAERSLSAHRPARDLHKKDSASFSLLEVSPKTGRTHQIRVHMKYLNYPIVCDTLYNPKGICPKGIKRLALHAKSIEFINLSGKKIKVESKIPKEFEGMLKYKDLSR